MTEQRPAEFQFRLLLQAFRRRFWIFLLCVVLVPATAIAVSLLQEKKYTTEASLLFRDPQFDQKLFGSSFVEGSGDPNREAATNVELVSLDKVAALTAKKVFKGGGADRADKVSEAVEIKAEGQSDVVTIEATAGSPRLATAIANTFAEEYVEFRREADREKIRAAQMPVRRTLRRLPKNERRGQSGLYLAERLSQLNVLASLQTGNAELVQPAQVPEEASSPNLPRNGAIAAAVGALLGIGLVLLIDRLDSRLRDPKEVEQSFERPILAALPESPALKDSDFALRDVPDAEREAFRMLRANLRYFSVSRDIRSVLITSSGSGDGKSTVAWGLAEASATAGSRTLLIEADLRHPTFATRHRLESRYGLTSVLTGEAGVQEAVTRVSLSGTENERRPEHAMDVLVAGAMPPNPSDLIESEQMTVCLHEAEAEYDLVVIDTPPTAVVSDAIPLLTMVDGVIVVSRLGKTTRDALRHLRQQLENVKAPVLGLVTNSVDRGAGYGYGYGQGYGYSSQDWSGPPSRPGRSHPSPHRDDRGTEQVDDSAAPVATEPRVRETEEPRSSPQTAGEPETAPVPSPVVDPTTSESRGGAAKTTTSNGSTHRTSAPHPRYRPPRPLDEHPERPQLRAPPKPEGDQPGLRGRVRRLLG